MQLQTKFTLLLFAATLVSCSSTEFHGMNTLEWKNDKGGCNGQRQRLVEVLADHKDELESMDVKTLRNLLGTPDRHELEKRNSRRFVYFTEAGPHCNGQEPLDTVPNLTVRIGPLGEVVEVTFYNQSQ